MSDIEYKLRARSKWDWRSFDTVRMEISIGQPYHEGAKLALAMNWARENFRRVVVIIGDSPQRYNLMFRTGFAETNAERLARGAGDAWIERNQILLHGIEITRWNEWKADLAYLPNRAAISQLYQANAEFRQSIHGAIQEFIERRSMGENDRKRFFVLSEQYLLEETAVFATAYGALGGISAYPGDFLKLWEMFIDLDDPSIPVGLTKAHCVRLAFNRMKLAA
ncbi:MAG: tRNA-dependent cyclodipeptide synthase [Pseudomonadota bacterium]|nr:tRNA-dependent cyclodipeptide synthase [Pseudomonadota bacterium]